MTRRAQPLNTAGEQLFVTDAQLAGMFGQGRERLRSTLRALEKEGFPQPDPLIGARYLPAVRAFLDRRYGVGAQLSDPLRPDGKENWGNDNET